MDKLLQKNYYYSELSKIDCNSQYPPTFKIRGENVETKWISLNEESAKILVDILIENFNLKIK